MNYEIKRIYNISNFSDINEKCYTFLLKQFSAGKNNISSVKVIVEELIPKKSQFSVINNFVKEFVKKYYPLKYKLQLLDCNLYRDIKKNNGKKIYYFFISITKEEFQYKKKKSHHYKKK